MKFFIFDNNKEIYLDDVEVDFEINHQPGEPSTNHYPGCSEEFEFTNPWWDKSKYSEEENRVIEEFLGDPENFQEEAEKQAKKEREDSYEAYIDSQMP